MKATETLKRLSKTITGENRMTLIKMYPWSEDDVVKACIDSDEGLLLLGLECKESTMADKRIKIGTLYNYFVMKILRMYVISCFFSTRCYV